MCAGLWVISQVFYIWVWRVGLSSRSRFFSVRVILLPLLFFVDFFILFLCFPFSFLILQMFTVTLLCGRTFVQLFLRVMMFYSHLRILCQLWLWLAELPVLHSSIPLPTTHGSLGREIMAWQLFSNLRFTLLFICVIRCLRRKQRSLCSQRFTALPGCISWVASRLLRSIRSWRVCAAFTGPPQIQEGAKHCLPVRTISCL